MVQVTSATEEMEELPITDFSVINQQLDAQTAGLLTQLQHIRKIHESDDNLTPIEKNAAGTTTEEQEDHGLASYVQPAHPTPTQPVGSTRPSAKYIDTRHRDKVDNKVLPELVKNLGNDGIIRFLKSKVQVLSDQLEDIQKEEKKLMEKNKELQTERERLSDDRDKWIQQANGAKHLLVKHEQQCRDMALQLQTAQADNNSLKKQVEKLKKELKQTSQSGASNEVRLNRANEEIEKLRSNLKHIKMEEKDMKEDQKKKIEDLTSALRRTEKQKIELLHVFKKQLLLVDGLKKQRGLVEAGKMLKSIEDDFMEFLDWSPNKS